MSERGNNDSVVEISKEEFAYGFIIEVITGGLYPNKFHVIREYVQNGFDAICKWRNSTDYDDEGKIDIKIEGNSIFIFDTGTGMTQAKINQYRYVGYSEKRLDEGTGFRGIGKLSGISVAEKLIVTTSPYGVAEKYRLEFNAQTMVVEILTLKAKGENIPLKELIMKHTEITSDVEDKTQHYTLIELHNIRVDSNILLNESELVKFLGLNVPVPFDPSFDYGDEIEEKIKEVVEDYETVDLTVNGDNVYKPYLQPCKHPQYEFVWDNKEENTLVAFCWYCQNEEKGQFDNKDYRGLIFKCKNFSVGDRNLTREKLFLASAERAYYFFGEVYVSIKNIMPTSERNNFVQNEARDKLYERGSEIGKTLSRIADKYSQEIRAIEKIDNSTQTLKQIEGDFLKGQISKELQIEKMVTSINIADDIEKRIKKAPSEEYKKKGRELVKRARELATKLNKHEEGDEIKGTFYDITKELSFTEDTKRLYELIVTAIRDEFIEQPEIYERVLKKIQSELKEKYK